MAIDNSELNLKIAELLELNIYRICDFPGCKIWLKPRFSDKYFDPINDPVQWAPLMLELLESSWTPHKGTTGEYYYYEKSRRDLSFFNKHFGAATCLAFIEMKENQ